MKLLEVIKELEDILWEDKEDRKIEQQKDEVERHCYQIGVPVDEYLDTLKKLDRDYLGQKFYIRKLERCVDEDYSD